MSSNVLSYLRSIIFFVLKFVRRNKNCDKGGIFKLILRMYFRLRTNYFYIEDTDFGNQAFKEKHKESKRHEMCDSFVILLVHGFVLWRPCQLESDETCITEREKVTECGVSREFSVSGQCPGVESNESMKAAPTGSQGRSDYNVTLSILVLFSKRRRAA